jgi:hypothetical protein
MVHGDDFAKHTPFHFFFASHEELLFATKVLHKVILRSCIVFRSFFCYNRSCRFVAIVQFFAAISLTRLVLLQ